MTMTRIFAPMPTYFGDNHIKQRKKKGVGASPIVARQPCKIMVGNEIYLFAPLKKRKKELKLLHCYMVRSKVMIGSFALVCHLF